jgi:hypothetical protein
MKSMLYFAFGSNLNIEAMARRCPKARKVGPFKLSHARLVFRGVADIEYHKTGKCPGGLWEITRECEKALDRYEGVSTGLYQKVYLKARIRDTGQVKNILVYQMCCDGIMPPDESYLNTIAQGYRDFGLDLAYLDRALQRSWSGKDKTPYLRKRRERRQEGPFATEINFQELT